MNIFIIVFIISFLIVFPGFEIMLRLSIKRKEIPHRGVHIWKHREFLFWNNYKRSYGDMFFLSSLNAFVVNEYVQSTAVNYRLFIVFILVAFIFAYYWFIITKRNFKTGKFFVWDWHFTAPDAHVTTAGKYHVSYLFLETIMVQFSLYQLWYSVNPIIKLGIFISLIGYLATVIYDVFIDTKTREHIKRVQKEQLILGSLASK